MLGLNGWVSAGLSRGMVWKQGYIDRYRFYVIITKQSSFYFAHYMLTKERLRDRVKLSEMKLGIAYI